MVSCTTRKIISLAISLLVVVISLTGVALGATAPTVSKLSRYYPGFAGAPGKMTRDVAGNFYVADFWGKGIVKLDRLGNRIGFVATNGRPTAVAVLADNRLVVAMLKPTPYVAFYSQTDGELSQFGPPAQPIYNPTGITLDAAGNIYVVDSGDNSDDLAVNVGKVRVYSPAGAYLTYFGARTASYATSTTGGQFKQPTGIAYEKQNDQIVVVDTQNGRLQFFKSYASDPACTYVASVGSVAGTGGAGTESLPDGSSVVKFYNPFDVAFEYNGAQLYRAYVVQRGRHEIAVVNLDVAGTYGAYLKVINGSTVTGGDMKLPSGVLYEPTSTGGVLYTNNAATSTAADVLSFSINSGTIPVPGASQLVMDPVPAVAPANPITVTGTTTPANAVVCTANGVAGTTTGTGSWSASLTLQAGKNHIVCKSTNNGVTAYTEADTYNGTPISTVAVSISQPSSTLYTPNASVTVSGSSDTANATVSLFNSLTNTTVTTQAGADKKWSAVVNLAEGSNAIAVTASKVGMNPSAPVSVTVVADYTAPALNISFLNTGATTNKAVQNIDGVVTDANLASITVNGVTVPASERVALAGNATYFSLPITLVRGNNTVTVTAVDLAGNSMSSSPRTVTLVPEAPGMTVDLPADNSYMTGAAAITASGSVDPAFNAVTAAGSPVTPSSGTWTTSSMSVAAGFGSYQFTASGAGVATVTEKRTINTDASFKQVGITSPAADLATNTATVVISGSVPASDPTPQISIDGAAAVNVTNYTPGTGAFSHTVSLASQGLHSVSVIANGGTTAIRNILYDTTLPDLSLQADSKVMPTTITGTIEPSVKMSAINAKFNSSPVTIPMSVITFDAYDGSGTVTWHANLAGYTYDSIEFEVLDPAGNVSKLAYKQGIPTGDIDGDGAVRLTDALTALRHVAGTERITDTNKFFNGDVGGLVAGHAARDGVIDITDSVLILNKAYGLMAF